MEITEKTRCVPPYKCVCDDETGAFTSLRKGVRTSPKVNSCLFLLSFIDNLSDTYAIGVANTGLSEQESAQRFEWDWRKKISHLRYVYAVYVCVIYIPMRGPGSSMYNVECDSSEMSTKKKKCSIIRTGCRKKKYISNTVPFLLKKKKNPCSKCSRIPGTSPYFLVLAPQ